MDVVSTASMMPSLFWSTPDESNFQLASVIRVVREEVLEEEVFFLQAVQMVREASAIAQGSIQRVFLIIIRYKG